MDQPERRRLSVDLVSLGEALDNASWDIGNYLDLETGGVFAITADVREELCAVRDRLDDNGESGPAALAAAIEQADLPAWLREAVLDADAVEQALGSRYLEVRRADSHDGYRDMEEFIETVLRPGLQDQLWTAIRGTGAFRRFKDVLARDPGEQERWYRSRDVRLRDRALEWLRSEGIEPSAGAD
jgi:hypothetical protein